MQIVIVIKTLIIIGIQRRYKEYIKKTGFLKFSPIIK